MNNNIQKLREELKLTREQLAQMLGVQPMTIYRHEKGKRRLTQESIEKYALALSCKPIDIISKLSVEEQKSLHNEIDWVLKAIEQAIEFLAKNNLLSTLSPGQLSHFCKETIEFLNDAHKMQEPILELQESHYRLIFKAISKNN